MPKYKNVSGQTLTIPGIGEIQAGAEVEADEINNANFELVADEQKEETKKDNKLNK